MPKILVKAVFDTNILHTSLSHQLLNHAVSEFIANNSSKPDIEVHWIVPQVVISERRYQMQQESRKLFPHLAKVEKLIGVNLNVTPEILDARIDEAITKESKASRLLLAVLDTSVVDIGDAMNRAVNRLAPFEIADGKEKGFRDFLIGQTLKQIIDNSPPSARTCRIIFVTNDKRLTEYAQEIIAGKSNASIYDNIDDVGSLIKTLSSDLDMELWDRIQEQVNNYFYDFSANTGLYTKESVYDLILEKFKSELSEKPTSSHKRINKQWRISRTIFTGKSQQRLSLESKVIAEYQILKEQKLAQLGLSIASPSPGLSLGQRLVSGVTFAPQTAATISLQGEPLGAEGYRSWAERLAGQPYQPPTEPTYVEESKGQIEFIVKWSVTLSTRGKLSGGKIGNIACIKKSSEKTEQ